MPIIFGKFQLFNVISVIDKFFRYRPMLHKIFDVFNEAFLEDKLQKCFSRFLRKESSSRTLLLQQNKETFFKIPTRLYGHRVFFHSANSLTLNTVCIKNYLSR